MDFRLHLADALHQLGRNGYIQDVMFLHQRKWPPLLPCVPRLAGEPGIGCDTSVLKEHDGVHSKWCLLGVDPLPDAGGKCHHAA